MSRVREVSPTLDIHSQAYNTLHARLRRTRGRAHERDCVDCGKPAMGWAHRHDTDPTDIANYDPRCKACHFRYDGHWMTKQREDNSHTAKLTHEAVAEIRNRYAAGGVSQRGLAAEFEVGRTTIGRIVRRERWV